MKLQSWPMSNTFITGGSGFLGLRLLASLKGRGPVIALDRSGTIQQDDRTEAVPGDLLIPSTYSGALKRSNRVVHLAALTGRGSERDHFRTNKEGTRLLIEACREAGIEEFLFVSSIAAKFKDKRSYYYAQAKEMAENLLRTSGMRFAIVRPTIIVGQGSPVLRALQTLAGLPVIPVFGDGKTMVQPIYVEDLVRFIDDIIDRGAFDGDTWELGGPSVVSFEELLQLIRQARGGNRARSIHLPITLLAGVLRLAERAGAGSLLPVTAGQLTSFHQDGTIESNPLFERRRAELLNVQQMLARSFG